MTPSSPRTGASKIPGAIQLAGLARVCVGAGGLLRRLDNQSRRNRIYRAFRELGRAVRTIVLLRYLSEPELREGITAITNRASNSRPA
jgi:TnpA family transposase